MDKEKVRRILTEIEDEAMQLLHGRAVVGDPAENLNRIINLARDGQNEVEHG